MTLDLNQRWSEFLMKASYHFKVNANQEFLLFIIGLQELGQGFKSYSKQEKMDIINLARCRLLTISNCLKQTGMDDEGWPTFEVLKDENELLPSERDRLMKESMMTYFDTHLFNPR
ncbi:MAG: hypothetical protein QM786_18790 [Breznakibacter sp.]